MSNWNQVSIRHRLLPVPLLALLTTGLTLLASPIRAEPVQVESQLVTAGYHGDTGNGFSEAIDTLFAQSADGRFVLFRSRGQSFVDGIVDYNDATDAFLHDRVAQTTVLVSRSADSADTTANGESNPTAISADGEWVVFESRATNLVPGVADTNGAVDVFLYQRSTGTVSLVSRSAAGAATANSASGDSAISADGEWVLISSWATNLVPGVVDGNGSDVFVYQRSTGAMRLVSRSAVSASSTANGLSVPTAISADGESVLFRSQATNLVPGAADANNGFDAFLYRRSTGAIRLVSRSEGSALAAGNGESFPASMSADGEWVVFHSAATDIVSGIADENGTGDVFLFHRDTGAVSLVSRSAGSATTANSISFGGSISADGEWMLFSSIASDLTAGIADSNQLPDVFLYQRSSGIVSLVSRSAASATAANKESHPIAISADGGSVLFRSEATNLVPGLSDDNGEPDLYLFQRNTGALSLVSRAAGAASTANNESREASMSADGEWVLFQSRATNLVSGINDNNNEHDLFLYRRSTATASLVSRAVSTATTTSNNESYHDAISADGEWVLFTSLARNIVPGVVDTNGGFNEYDVFLFQRSTGAASLISRSAASATATANRDSYGEAISSNGEWALFSSWATDLVPGIVDTNGNFPDAFLYRRSTGTVSLVSRSATSPAATGNGSSDARAMSADGEWILLNSEATDLIPGVVDSNASNLDVFLYQRSTGTVSLVSRAAGSAMTTANSGSSATAMTSDGEWVLFRSWATNLVPGVADNNNQEDAFLYQRSTGTVSLVSRSAGSAMATANNKSFPSAISADGEWVLFGSEATNLVAGITDGNAAQDAFLYQRSTGAVSLVSRSSGLPTATANARSMPTSISADGAWVLFQSQASDVVPGVVDGNGSSDGFLFERSTGAVRLVSRSAASATIAANQESIPSSISADGEWVLFESKATNVMQGVADNNGRSDVFLYRRSSGAVSLLSHSVDSAATTANGNSTDPVMSADGASVLYRSSAPDLVRGVLDGNGTTDVFVARIDGLFRSGFE